MGTVTLIAKVPFLYASRTLVIGDAFDASEADAKILRHIGHAADAPRTYSHKDITAETSAEPVKVKRPTYRQNWPVYNAFEIVGTQRTRRVQVLAS